MMLQAGDSISIQLAATGLRHRIWPGIESQSAGKSSLTDGFTSVVERMINQRTKPDAATYELIHAECQPAFRRTFPNPDYS